MVAGRALRPISRITATARSISDRTLDARIALEGPRDELRELADTFDSMLERLEAAFESQRRFVANASHELRTPLAIVRTELDVTLDDPDADRDDLRAMAYVVRDANERMERLIASLLRARLQRGGHRAGALGRPRRDRRACARPRGGLRRRRGPAARCRRWRRPPSWATRCLLERLAENLIENAVRYNAAVGWVRVRTGIERGEAVLHVANAGARIDPGAVEELLEPFRRLESSRARATGGYGLGLAVVRAVAQAHGGRVARARAPRGRPRGDGLAADGLLGGRRAHRQRPARA